MCLTCGRKVCEFKRFLQAISALSGALELSTQNFFSPIFFSMHINPAMRLQHRAVSLSHQIHTPCHALGLPASRGTAKKFERKPGIQARLFRKVTLQETQINHTVQEYLFRPPKDGRYFFSPLPKQDSLTDAS